MKRFSRVALLTWRSLRSFASRRCVGSVPLVAAEVPPVSCLSEVAAIVGFVVPRPVTLVSAGEHLRHLFARHRRAFCQQVGQAVAQTSPQHVHVRVNPPVTVVAVPEAC